jgi:hypothetical protein
MSLRQCCGHTLAHAHALSSRASLEKTLPRALDRYLASLPAGVVDLHGLQIPPQHFEYSEEHAHPQQRHVLQVQGLLGASGSQPSCAISSPTALSAAPSSPQNITAGFTE